MKHLCHLFMFSVALVVGTSSAHGATTLLTTTLLGSNETPPNASTATGSALVTLEGDNNTLDVNETFAGLIGGPASAAHIHCCASPGVAAVVAVPFPNFPAATSGQYVNSFDLSNPATYNAAFITAHGGTVDSAKAAFIAALKTGQTYANIHNATFPGGEIRGQLAFAGAPVLTTTLLGSNETPPNTSTATGSAFVELGSDNKTLNVSETFAGLIGGLASAAHIHCCASPGVAAIVAVPFPNFPAATSGGYINSFDLSVAGTYNAAFITAHGGTVDSAKAAFITALKTGQTYVNIHNATFPGGEIRGQLAPTNTHDFNVDGKSDILWREITSGGVAMWLMNRATVTASLGVGNVTADWSIVGQRDFNGDGRADILWRNANGGVAMWLMNGGLIISSLGVGNVPTNWQIVGTGDFNGDGMGDILWRDNNSGGVALWLMNGATVTASLGVGNLPTNWVIAGTGDFNGDGMSDILWRDTASGGVAMWLMNGATILSALGVGNVPLNWVIAGTGDFNADGMADILWRDNNSGGVVIWLMNGATVTSSLGVGSVPTNWQIAQTGDYNGDGKSDILWGDTASGGVAMWLMNGATVTSSLGVGSVPTDWRIQGLNAD